MDILGLIALVGHLSVQMSFFMLNIPQSPKCRKYFLAVTRLPDYPICRTALISESGHPGKEQVSKISAFQYLVNQQTDL